MDYEKAAQDLFEKLLGEFARSGDTAQFCEMCAKYPELLAEFERKAEEEAAKIQLPDYLVEQVRENIPGLPGIRRRKN